MGYPSDKEILRLLTNDPLSNANRIPGEEEKNASNLGFMMNVYNNMAKEEALAAIGDTIFNMDWLAYCEMIEKFGFGLMLEDFSPDGGAAIRIYYHEKDGLLLKADSVHGNRNSALVYYNWQFDTEPKLKPKEEWEDSEKPEYYTLWNFTSSGGLYYPGHYNKDIPNDRTDPAWKDVVWAGYHDAREGVGYNMRRLRDNGTFVQKWKKQPYMYLLGHWEKDSDSKEVNKNRIERLPQWVQDNIRGLPC